MSLWRYSDLIGTLKQSAMINGVCMCIKGPLWEKNFWIFLFKMEHSGVFYISEWQWGPQMSWGPCSLLPFSTSLLIQAYHGQFNQAVGATSFNLLLQTILAQSYADWVDILYIFKRYFRILDDLSIKINLIHYFRQYTSDIFNVKNIVYISVTYIMDIHDVS